MTAREIILLDADDNEAIRLSVSPGGGLQIRFGVENGPVQVIAPVASPAPPEKFPDDSMLLVR